MAIGDARVEMRRRQVSPGNRNGLPRVPSEIHGASLPARRHLDQPAVLPHEPLTVQVFQHGAQRTA